MFNCPSRPRSRRQRPRVREWPLGGALLLLPPRLPQAAGPRPRLRRVSKRGSPQSTCLPPSLPGAPARRAAGWCRGVVAPTQPLRAPLAAVAGLRGRTVPGGVTGRRPGRTHARTCLCWEPGACRARRRRSSAPPASGALRTRPAAFTVPRCWGLFLFCDCKVCLAPVEGRMEGEAGRLYSGN